MNDIDDDKRDRGAALRNPHDIDAAFPILTKDVGTVTPSSTDRGEGELGRLASNAISDVLGWKFRPGDAKGFVAALSGSFDLTQIEGHTEATWRPRGYAVQADLGAVTGAQASLAARARTAIKDSLTLLDALTPLRVDFDPQDAELFRSLVRDDMRGLLHEFESPLIRVPKVDQLFAMLLFNSAIDVDTRRGGVGGGPITDENVGGHLGRLRDEFGLISRLVNTIEEERVQTSFITLVDWNVSLFEGWTRVRARIDPFNPPTDSSGFFGPALIALSQLMAATAAQVEELWAALDSVLINAGEREVLRVPVPPVIPTGGGGSDLDTAPKESMTLGGLTRWVHEFALNDGKKMAELGKDGVDNAFVQVARRLQDIVGALPRRFRTPPGEDNTRDFANTLPAGFFSRRVQIAIDELHDDLQEIVRIAQSVHHPDDFLPESNGSAKLSDKQIDDLVARLKAELSPPAKPRPRPRPKA
ncbi:hypothetical protein Lesp02_56820 [Lentzea sp. NBRC 105346]|uniref:hypothetical protein n=1 Tax=Lentzea sp. NBRC 105346 TaxID=3032205 RepID=UPI00249FB12D|nr:hypothetical protein [Lentzea sp. NBRC 105346]GLZ33494.1 hypothetical protein Lesp02_56820 [Lentzea sp. NBRC 105346]